MVICCYLSIFLAHQVHAGFLDMPETDEVPELERKTLLMDVDIPNVRERDPDPQGGPRINITEFRIQGIVEYPEMGITRAELIKRVEAIRFDIMKEEQLLNSGYTESEVSEVSELLAQIEEETKGEHVSPVEVQRLVFLIRDQRRKRGVTLGMIESVADVITRYYREHGFILAKAFIPEQQVRGGVVILTLLLGELGEVSVNDNARYPDKIIERAFDSAMGEPITATDMEERLYLVNDLPGLSVRGYFEPGTQVGDTKFNINTVAEQYYHANIRLDNHGSEGSGKNRLYADAMIYNPTKTGDQLQIGALASFEPANTLYGMLRYQTNILHPRVILSAGASSNEFTLDQQEKELSALDISGKSRVYDISINFKLRRTRVFNHSVDLTANKIDSNSSLGFDASEGDKNIDVVENLMLGYNFDLLNERARSLHQGSVKLSQSSLIEGLELGQEKEGLILNLDYSWLTFFKLPFTRSESRIMTRFSGQYTEAPIASSMQFGLGGPTLARGFAVNEFYADEAAYLGFDWIFNGPGFNNADIGGEKLSNMIQPYLFVDAAYGNKRSISANTGEADVIAKYGDTGVGLRLSFKGFRSNIIYSKPFKEDVSTSIEDVEKESKVYFDVQYSL